MVHSMIQEALFADDSALIANKHEDLQAILNKFSEASKQFSLTISLGKTEILFQLAPNSKAPQTRITTDVAELRIC